VGLPLSPPDRFPFTIYTKGTCLGTFSSAKSRKLKCLRRTSWVQNPILSVACACGPLERDQVFVMASDPKPLSSGEHPILHKMPKPGRGLGVAVESSCHRSV